MSLSSTLHLKSKSNRLLREVTVTSRNVSWSVRGREIVESDLCSFVLSLFHCLTPINSLKENAIDGYGSGEAGIVIRTDFGGGVRR